MRGWCVHCVHGHDLPLRPRTFVDRGGTFTDVVTVEGGRTTVRKVPSDAAIVGELAVGALTFGTTVVTNALLERRHARVLLVVTRGFADLAHIGDMTRPGLFDPDTSWPPPMCHRIVELGGRHGPDGTEVEPLTLTPLDVSDVDVVAIIMFGSGWNATHERCVAAALPPAMPRVLGHELSPEVGYLVRIETALVEAALAPELGRALARDRIPEDATAIRSDGGLVRAASLRASDAVLSGPAGGVLAVVAVARSAGISLAIGLDMGGTSTDVSIVEPGSLWRRESGWRVDGVRIGRPALEVETIAAGGGSILGHDGLGWSVGPGSAGADPGPQVWGRGGPPTLTDAAIAAGLVDLSGFSRPTFPERIELPGPAEGFLAVAREAMATAVRRLALRRGVDVREGALVAFGGAAGQHACAVAALLGVREVIVHVCAPVLSAWGQAFAEHFEESTEPLWCELSGGWGAVEAAWGRLGLRLPAEGRVEREVDVRVRGTQASIPVRGASASEVERTFLGEHRRRYGYPPAEAGLEVVNARVRVITGGGEPAPCPEWPEHVPQTLNGPAIVALDGTTLVVEAGWTLRREGPLLRLRHVARSAAAEVDVDTSRALWGARFAGVAEASGEVLRRLARSVNIRERLDFSCAVFDGEGTLVANAPHVPVHLGAMGETVRDVLRAHPNATDGESWLTNDPAAGGSHLPDLTVVQCVRHQGARFFVANRAHHVDVGGITPGSMPPHSTRLADEGRVFRRVPLGTASAFVAPDIAGVRDPETVAADLRAQMVANAHAAAALKALGDGVVLQRSMSDLVDTVERRVREVVPGWSGAAEDDVDGVPLAVHIAAGTFDFSGTGGPHPGNLNAPAAVTRAAVIYVLRVLVGTGLPLNEGVLRAVELVIPPGSILDPPPGAAVVGGNVETSQRLVDLCFRALGARADGQGTMNNLSFGGEGWAFYETLGGGSGASVGCAGRGGGQVHMTNTRATDPEVMEARIPLRLHTFSLRRGSGGRGAISGGDGLVREIELLQPATAALLAAWRPGARGLAGGGPGAAGTAEVRISGAWTPWSGAPVLLAAGDRVRVRTPGGGGFSPV